MGGTMKDIKLRIKSVEGTMQITKAMELVASSKLRRARARMERSRPYFETLYATLCDMAAADPELQSPYLSPKGEGKVCYIVIAGDRGLAGGYNANVFKTAAAHMEGKNVCVLPIGKKSVEHAARRGWEVVSDAYAEAADVSLGDCAAAARMLCGKFRAGEFDELYVV